MLAAHRTVLQKFARMLLPRFAHFILLVEADGSYAVAGFRAGDDEDGALTSWHNGGRLLMVLRNCKKMRGIWKLTADSLELGGMENESESITYGSEGSLKISETNPINYQLQAHPPSLQLCRNPNTPETATAPSPAAVTN